MLIFAHRGLHDRKTSENTLVAFQRAMDAGVDGIEFDLRVSRDGVGVVIHDENLSRVAGDARRVRDLTADELRDVALRGQGHIPTLNEVTAAIPAPFIFDIEIKDRDALEILIKKLKTSAGLRERTIVSSFVLDDLIRLKQEVPQIRTIALNRAWPLLFRANKLWKRLQTADVWAVGFPGNTLNKRRIAALRKRRWQVATWDLQPLKRQARRISRLAPDVAIVYKVDDCRA